MAALAVQLLVPALARGQAQILAQTPVRISVQKMVRTPAPALELKAAARAGRLAALPRALGVVQQQLQGFAQKLQTVPCAGHLEKVLAACELAA